MLTVLDYLEIRKAHASGESMRSIARRLGHCQKSVRRAIRSGTGEPLPYTRGRPVGYPKLGPFVAVIDQILRDDESAPRKQRHHASRIYERLKSEHGYAGSYYPVRRHVASLRQRACETFMRLDHVPGRRMELRRASPTASTSARCRWIIPTAVGRPTCSAGCGRTATVRS